MTGATIARQMLLAHGIEAVVLDGSDNYYRHGERIIVLRDHVFHGTSKKNLTLAAHEVGHAAQEARWGWAAPAIRWLMLGRLWLEWDASRRACVLMREQGMEPRVDALRECYSSYLWPALWQTAALVVLLALIAWRYFA